jgi:hypothetical protein
MNHFYVRAGGVERPRHRGNLPCDYRWRQGFSRVVGGALTQPWSTLQEARDGAKVEGVKPVVCATLEEAVVAEREHRRQAHFIRFDIWALSCLDSTASGWVLEHCAYDLDSALQRLDFLGSEVNMVKVVHPAQWTLDGWTIHNGAPAGKKSRSPRVCRCARYHTPVSDTAKKPVAVSCCYGDTDTVDFAKYHRAIQKGALREYFQRRVD